MPKTNKAVTAAASISAATVESHIPSNSQKSGKIRTVEHWKTKVLKKEISADMIPFPKAVKKEEPKIAMPEHKKEKENIVKARMVMANRLSSYPANRRERGLARVWPATSISREKIPIRKRLFFNNPLSSPWLPAP